MSFPALAWASLVKVRRASDKLVLFGLADRHNTEHDLAYPSLAWLAEFSSLDRKTIVAALDRLEVDGFIADSGQRVGKTKQVKAYRLNFKSADFGQVKTAPLSSKSSDFSDEQSQKRNTEPVLNQSEAKASSISCLPTLVMDEKRAALGSCLQKAFPVETPEWMPESWAEFRAMRKAMRNVPFGDGAERRCIAKLARLRAEGHDPEKLISKAVENGHRTFFEDATTKAGPQQRHKTAAEWRENAEFYARRGERENAEECRKKAIELETRQAA